MVAFNPAILIAEGIFVPPGASAALNNIYAANFTSGTVSKISQGGTVSGSWATVGSDPYAIAIDSAGNVYTANYGANTVSKISPAGVVTSPWATVGASPRCICIDSAGNVYTASSTANTITKITSAGTVTAVWATVGSGPYAIAVDSAGNVYTANYTAGTISKVTSAGSVTTTWATVGTSPQALAFDSAGNLYVANVGSASVSKITSAGSVTTTWATVGTSPFSICIDPLGNVYTANEGPGTVSKVTPSGTVTLSYATVGSSPFDIAVDGLGNLYTANYGSGTVSKITPSGTVTAAWATVGTNPVGVAAGPMSLFLLLPVTSTPFIEFYDATLNPVASPATLPSSTSISVKISPNSTFAAISSGASILLYALQSGAPVYLTTVTANATVEGMAFSPDSSLLAVLTETSPYLTIYSTSTWTSTATLSGANIPSAVANNGIAWSPDQTKICFGLQTTPYMVEVNYPAMTLRTAPSTLPTAFVISAAYSPNGAYLALAQQNTANNIIIYATSTMTKLADPSSPGLGSKNNSDASIAWRGDSSALASVSTSSPYIWLFTVSGTTITKVANPSTLPTSACRGVVWKSSGAVLFVLTQTTSPSFITFNWNGTTLSAGTTPTQPTSASLNSLASTL